MSRPLWASWVVSLLLVSCAQLPQLADHHALPVAPEHWQAGYLAEKSETEPWVEAFDDPRLSSLVEEAQANNLGIAGLEATVRRARALSSRARAELAPDVLLGADASTSETGGVRFSTGQFGISASWEPDVWGRLRAGLSAARFDLAAAEADELAARRILTGAVVDAYVLAVEARLQSRVADRNHRALDQTLSFVTVQYERGLRSGRDIALIRSDTATAEASLVAVGNAERDALRALETLLGRYPSTELDLPSTLPEQPASMPASRPPGQPVRAQTGLTIGIVQGGRCPRAPSP